MIVICIFTALTVLCIVAYQREWCDEFVLVVLGGLSVLILVICLISAFTVYFEGIENVIKYNQKSAYIDALSDNNQLTDTERKSAVDMVIDINSDIELVRYWRDSLIGGVFVYGPYGDLDKIDISKIKPARYQVGVD